MLFSKNMAFAEFVLEIWLTKVKFPALKSLVGKKGERK